MSLEERKKTGLFPAIKTIGIILTAALIVTGGLYTLATQAVVGPARNNPSWIPKELVKDFETQAAVNDEKIFFRFKWEQPDPGGWYHDMIVYKDGEWRRFVEPDPWVAEEDAGHTGFYEDRLSFLIDDGSVRGFSNFGGWLTAHRDGMRSLPGEVDSDVVQAHPHLGVELGRSDVRKYIPQSRTGEWWEGPWDEVKSLEELGRIKKAGGFLDLPMWRGHRSNAVGYGTGHWVLDYRHGDDGSNTFGTQGWDPEEGPEYMWNPDIIERGALDINEIYNDPSHYRQDLFHAERDDWVGEYEPYYLHEDWMVPFDPDVAQWEGAAIPRRPLREPEGSAATWRARGTWEDGEWTVEMWRDLDTGYDDDKRLDPGRVYDWAPAVHHGFNARWHWIAYPYKLGIGVSAEDTGADPVRFVEAVRFDGARPDWNRLPVKTIPLIYPGLVDWSWLVSRMHPGYEGVRNDTVSIWDIHPRPKQMMVASLLPEAPARALNWPLVLVGVALTLAGIYFTLKNVIFAWRSL